MVVVLWYPVGVQSPTAVGRFTGARLLAGGFTGAERLAGGCGICSRNCTGTATVGGFTDAAGLLAGGCGIMWELNPLQQLVDSQVLDCYSL